MEYRFYGFGNYYLSSLQQGLQAGHCVAELFVQNVDEKNKSAIVYDWAANHKTMVLLNGGNSGSLQELYDFFSQLKRDGMDLPFVKFHEDQVSLGGALTYVGMIVPSYIYDLAVTYRGQLVDPNRKANWDEQLAYKLNEFGLAK